MSDTQSIRCSSCFEEAASNGVCRACGESQDEFGRDRRALPVGTLVSAKYIVGRVLGSGGFGITYLAQDSVLGRRVALKEYLPVGLVSRHSDRVGVECNSDEDAASFRRGLDRFFREGQILAKFDHPNIVRVQDVVRAHGTAYLAMEYLDGTTLKSWITSAGRLEPDMALKVVGFILDALKVVHGLHVVHRDVKPDNVYVTRHGRTLLLDFGGAKQLTAEGDRSTDAMFAHGYAAPEQYFADSGRVGPWTDVYACGATLYKMLTGLTMRSAWDRYSDDTALEWGPAGVPDGLQDVIRHAVELKQTDRYQTIDALSAALRHSWTAPPPDLVPAAPGSSAGAAAAAPVPTPTPTPTPTPLPAPIPASRTSDPAPPDPFLTAVPLWKQPAVVGAAAVALCVAGVVVWQSGSSRTGRSGETPSAAAVPASGLAPTASAPAAVARTGANGGALGAAPAPAAADTTATSGRIDDALDAMIAGAAAQDWPRVDASARSIQTLQRQLATGAAGAPPELVTAGEDAIGRSDYAAAAASLRNATLRAPRDAMAWSALGYALLRLNKMADARTALGNGLRLQPDGAGAWAHLGEVLAADSASSKAAVAALRLAVHFAPDRAATLARLRATSRNRISPEFQAIIRGQGNRLDQIPEMTK